MYHAHLTALVALKKGWKVDSSRDLVFSGNRKVILIDGHTAFTRHVHADSNIATFLTGSYADVVAPECVGTNEVGRLFGQFALVRHDPVARLLVVMTDRFGHVPLYMAFGIGPDDTCLLLSTDYQTLARRVDAAAFPDHGAMSDVLAFNVPFDRRTPSSRITSFGARLSVSIDLDTLSTQQQVTWDPVALLAQANLSFDSVKDTLVDLFLEGVSMATTHAAEVGVTLSGGADSRCLLAASLHIGKRTQVYSTGVPGSRALTYAHEMASLCRVPENPRPLNEAFLARLPALMHESNSLMQGMSFSSELEAMWLREHVSPHGVLLHGAFAELYKIGKMHNFHYDANVAATSGSALSEQLWKRFAGRYALRRSGFARPYADLLGEQAHTHLADKVAGYQRDLDTAAVLQMVYIDEFLGKVAKASWNMWRQRTPTMFPFAYPPLVDLILRVRTLEKTTNRFVVHLLKRTNKALAAYPDSNTGVRIGASRAHRELVHVIDYATNRLFRSKARADHQDFADWLSRMQPALAPLFDDLQAATGAFDMGQIRGLITRCHAGDDLAARTLQFLWAWGLWYIGQQKSSTVN